MSKLIKATLVITIIASLFLIINIFQTKESIRFQDIENSTGSYNFYIKDNKNISLKSELEFLSNLSKKEKVSIFKTDSGDNGKIIKSVVYNYDTFPYKQFGLSKKNLFKNSNNVYSNKSKDNSTLIPSFNKYIEVELKTLDNTYHDPSNSIIGKYTIVPNSDNNKDRILNKLSKFFNEDKYSLQTPSVHEATGFLNLSSMIIIAIIIGVFLILICLNLIAPLSKIDSIGIKKLNGWSDTSIFYKMIGSNVFIIFLTSILVDIFILLYYSYLPKYFLINLIISQFIIFLIYLISNILSYFIIKNITIQKLISNFVNMHIGIVTTYVVKCLVMFVTVGVILLLGNNVKELTYNYELNRNWQNYHNIMTIEYTEAKGNAEYDLLTGNILSRQRFFNLYKQLEDKTDAQYIHVDNINPKTNLFNDVPEYGRYFNSSDKYNVVHVNFNFLVNNGFKKYISIIPDNQRTFLVPIEYKTIRNKIDKLLQGVIYQGLSEKDQKNIKLQSINTKIVYYNEFISLFSYNSELQNKIKNPIVAVFNDKNMDLGEKAMLSSTGLNNSPIKIKYNSHNLKEIKNIINNQKGENKILPKFTKIGTLLSDQVSSSQSAIKVLILVIIALLFLNIFSSFFLSASVIQSNKQIISIKKLHGYKLFDRYKTEIIIFLVLYSFQFIILLIFLSSFLVLPLVFITMFIDAIITINFIRYFEHKSLNSILRGE